METEPRENVAKTPFWRPFGLPERPPKRPDTAKMDLKKHDEKNDEKGLPQELHKPDLARKRKAHQSKHDMTKKNQVKGETTGIQQESSFFSKSNTIN